MRPQRSNERSAVARVDSEYCARGRLAHFEANFDLAMCWPLSQRKRSVAAAGRVNTGDRKVFTELLVHVHVKEIMESIMTGEACAKPGRTWASRAAVRAESRRERQFYRSVCPLVLTDSCGSMLC
jgi:hypothetical protein